MLTINLKGKIRQKLLEFFFSTPGTRIYLRELERQLVIPAGSLQRHLAQLEKEGILKSEWTGPLKYFSLNPQYPYFQELQSVILREQRKRELEKNLKKLVRSLKENYQPEKIILFGSLASGRVSPDSDLDLLIVKKGLPQRYWDRVKEIAPFLLASGVGVDYVIWSPEELIQETGKNKFLKEEILEKGKILYDRTV